MPFSVIEKLAHLRDIIVGNRADGRILAWSDADDAHVYIDPPGGGGGFDGDHNDLDGRDATGAHPIGSVTGLQGALDGKADDPHTHDYAPTGHSHTESDVTDLGTYPDAVGQPSGRIAQTDGGAGWTFITTPAGGGGATRGTATIDDPDTHVDVPHGLDQAPERGEIQVTPANDLGTASIFWVSDFGVSTFRINVDTAPGTTAEFDWLHVPASTSGVVDGAILTESGFQLTTESGDVLIIEGA